MSARISKSFPINYKPLQNGYNRDLILQTVDYSSIKFGPRLNQTDEFNPHDKPCIKYYRKTDLSCSSPRARPSLFFSLALLKIFQTSDKVREAKRRNLLKSPARPANRVLLFSIAQPRPRPIPLLTLNWRLAFSLEVNLLKSSSSSGSSSGVKHKSDYTVLADSASSVRLSPFLLYSLRSGSFIECDFTARFTGRSRKSLPLDVLFFFYFSRPRRHTGSK